MRDVARLYKTDISKTEDRLTKSKYSDLFFTELLGVRNLQVLDNSNYEGAGLVHDLNLTIPKNLENSFDVIVDSGTFEHVFNFPVAISNCMKMLKVGGTLFICTPTNNYMGHGFYQFSPEVFFRILDKDNGFEIKNAILVKHPYPAAELSSNQKMYDVIDPNLIRQRGGLMSKFPALIMIEAKKISDTEIFKKYPQQSDYSTLWNKTENNIPKKENVSLKNKIKKILDRLPKKLRNFIWGNYWKYYYSINNRKFFKKRN